MYKVTDGEFTGSFFFFTDALMCANDRVRNPEWSGDVSVTDTDTDRIIYQVTFFEGKARTYYIPSLSEEPAIGEYNGKVFGSWK